MAFTVSFLFFSKNYGIRRIVDETSTIIPDLRKELLYWWQYGFIEDKLQEIEPSRTNLLRKDEKPEKRKSAD